VWERALDKHFRSSSLWLKYAEMEMTHKNVNHARNVWDRAISLLPRVDQFWYKVGSPTYVRTHAVHSLNPCWKRALAFSSRNTSTPQHLQVPARSERRTHYAFVTSCESRCATTLHAPE
jgi:hypothetical protein